MRSRVRGVVLVAAPFLTMAFVVVIESAKRWH